MEESERATTHVSRSRQMSFLNSKMPRLSVMFRGKTIVFESNMSNRQARGRLKKMIERGVIYNPFAKVLASLKPRSLSELQWAWIHKIVLDHALEKRAK